MATTSERLILGKKSLQITCGEVGYTTGFAIASFAAEERYVDPDANYYYILLVRQGTISLSCKLYKYKRIATGTMAFIPKGSRYEFTASEDSEIMFFAFGTTLIRTDNEMLEYFCHHAGKRSYTFNTLPIRSGMDDLITLIDRQLRERRMKNGGIAQVWNSYFFHTMVAYYSKDENTAFMRPIISGAVDFEAFVENNYLEADGNVAQLAALSGMSYDAFQDKFIRIYGVTAKQWLDERTREQLISLAKTPSMTPQEMAAALRCTAQKLNKLCQRYWSIPPGELIRRWSKSEQG